MGRSDVVPAMLALSALVEYPLASGWVCWLKLLSRLNQSVSVRDRMTIMSQHHMFFQFIRTSAKFSTEGANLDAGSGFHMIWGRGNA